MGKPDPDASDWSDLDLLTVDEATERLDEEIATIAASLDDLPVGLERDAAAKRLRLLHAARDRARAGPQRPLYRPAPEGDDA